MPLTQIAVHPSDNVPQSGKPPKKPQPTPIKKKDSAKVNITNAPPVRQTSQT
uniref:RING-CH-type domain-containing protein n=1 Tax=Magallana gigas TaxID=29159 RepID=A0A8W8MWA1_MAGGI